MKCKKELTRDLCDKHTTKHDLDVVGPQFATTIWVLVVYVHELAAKHGSHERKARKRNQWRKRINYGKYKKNHEIEHLSGKDKQHCENVDYALQSS